MPQHSLRRSALPGPGSDGSAPAWGASPSSGRSRRRKRGAPGARPPGQARDTHLCPRSSSGPGEGLFRSSRSRFAAPAGFSGCSWVPAWIRLGAETQWPGQRRQELRPWRGGGTFRALPQPSATATAAGCPGAAPTWTAFHRPAKLRSPAERRRCAPWRGPAALRSARNPWARGPTAPGQFLQVQASVHCTRELCFPRENSVKCISIT